MNSLQIFIEKHALQWMFDLFTASIILLGFWLFFRITKPALTRLLFRNGLDNYLVDIAINSIYRGIVIIIAIMTALAQIGINVLAAMTGFGIAGIAISFAAKDTLGNIIAGITILWDKPFIVGDWIEIDGQYGQVQFITLRTTRIHTTSNHHIIIPNQTVINSNVENYHHARPVRRTATLYVPYGTNIEKAKEVILESIRDEENILQKPETIISVGEASNSLIPLSVLLWAPNARVSIGATSVVYNKATTALIQHNFSVPHPVILAESPKITQKITRKRATKKSSK